MGRRSLEVGSLNGPQKVERFAITRLELGTSTPLASGQHELPHDADPVRREEHMLGST
jgi:hypothetical protein